MKKVLIVEDDPINGLVLVDFLTAQGYEAILARNGVNGVASFQMYAPAMVLADVHLPRKNGFEVCFDIKRTERGSKTPVLLMSAVYTDVRTRRATCEAECWRRVISSSPSSSALSSTASAHSLAIPESAHALSVVCHPSSTPRPTVQSSGWGPTRATRWPSPSPRWPCWPSSPVPFPGPGPSTLSSPSSSPPTLSPAWR